MESFGKFLESFRKFWKVSESFRKFLKVSESFRKFLKVSESFRKFQKVSESFRKFQKVSESFRKFQKVLESYKKVTRKSRDSHETVYYSTPVAGFADMFVLVCSMKRLVTLQQGGHKAIACLSGKGHGKKADPHIT